MSGSDEGRSRDARAAINENTFREINEQLVAAVALSARDEELHDVVCECARIDCTELITLSVEEYNSVRETGDRFIIAAGPEHLIFDLEHIIEQNDRYRVVEKIGTAGEIADELDPRGNDP